MYCFTTDSELTDEHIIAYALGGILILPKSSCKLCAKITSKFETVILKHLWKIHRSKYKYPTRRYKERITEVKIESANMNFTVPIAEYPAPIFMYKCTKAGILQGCNPNYSNIENWQIIALVNSEEMKFFYNKHGKDVKYPFKNVFLEFAQMLAKIAYTYAIGIFGVGVFEPLVLDFIMKKVGNPGYLVGGSLEIKPPVCNGGHILDFEILVTELNSALLIINIRLLSSAETPYYHVVVGKLPNKEAIDRLLKIARNHKDISSLETNSGK